MTQLTASHSVHTRYLPLAALLVLMMTTVVNGSRELRQNTNYAALLSRLPPGTVLVIDANGNLRLASATSQPQLAPTPVQLQARQSARPQQQPALAPAATQSSSGEPSNCNSILDLHNSLRARHRAPPLAWNAQLVASAQNWANNLANSCSFYHSGPGENMATGYNNWNDVIMAFYNEIRAYNYNAPGYSSATGHATQLLWVSSQQLGCATAQRAGCWQNVVYVCHYQPVGNVNRADYFQANVLPPAA